MLTYDPDQQRRHGASLPPCPRCKNSEQVERDLHTGRATYYRCVPCAHLWVVREAVHIDDEDESEEADD